MPLFEEVLFRDTLFKLDGYIIRKDVLHVLISDKVPFQTPDFINAQYDIARHTVELEHFFYPARTKATSDYLFDKMVEGPNRDRATFAKDIMIILKLVAVYTHCTTMTLSDGAVNPENNYTLSLNALKRPYAGYYSKNHGFFPNSIKRHANDLPSMVVLANEFLERNHTVAHVDVPDTVQHVVAQYYEYKRTGRAPIPLNPLMLPEVRAQLDKQFRLMTAFTDTEWIEFDTISEQFHIVPIPYDIALVGNRFVITDRFEPPVPVLSNHSRVSFFDTGAPKVNIEMDEKQIVEKIQHEFDLLKLTTQSKPFDKNAAVQIAIFMQNLVSQLTDRGLEKDIQHSLYDFMIEKWSVSDTTVNFLVPQSDPLYDIFVQIFEQLIKDNPVPYVFFYAIFLDETIKSPPDTYHIYEAADAEIPFTFMRRAFSLSQSEPFLNALSLKMREKDLFAILADCIENAHPVLHDELVLFEKEVRTFV